MSDVALLFGISAAGFGMGYGFLAGFTRIPELVSSGGLDSYLLKPRHVVLQVLASRSEPSAWGDLVSGFVLIAASGHLHWSNLPLLVVSLICAASIFVAAGLVFNSLAFWLRDSQDLSWRLWELVITFSLYPESIYPQLGRILLYTVLPAGFISFLPVRLLKSASLLDLAYLILGTAAIVAASAWVFRKGLIRYESGNRWSMHAT